MSKEGIGTMWRKKEGFTAGHRLMYDEGPCKNPHGHDYKLDIGVTGEQDEEGIILHSQVLKESIRSVVGGLDHTFLLSNEDEAVIAFWEKMKWDHHVLDFQPTVENLVKHCVKETKKQIIKRVGASVTRLQKIRGILDENTRNVAEYELDF